MSSKLMTPDEHRRVQTLFHKLRELPESEWQTALDPVCGDDPELRQHVLLLLGADRDAEVGLFLERGAMQDTARLISPEPSVSGSLLGSYRLGPCIGSGGMGSVYEAQDLKLHRRVAIKILTMSMEPGADERIKRFQREARAASQLNHPNIVSIFDAGFDRGYYYLATEFVDGKTLDKLTANGPLERKLLLEIAIQICSALGAAHDAGIVHRDIKPENVMLRPDGIVKVLDFGLAKLMEPSKRPNSDVLTRVGMVAGTPQFMSPEQLLGKPVGPQSDIFSTGVLLYQLATGERPFDGPTYAAILTAIVSKDPTPPSVRVSSIDPALDALILRALDKDPDLRFQTANDMRSALRLLLRSSQIRSSQSSPAIQTANPQPAGARPGWWIPTLAWLGGMALMAALWYAAPTRSTLPLPNRFERMTYGDGEEVYPNLSPDAKQFVYASQARGNWDIYLQRTGGSAAINLTETSMVDDSEPALSRDGSRIAFRSERDGGSLYVMEVTGENPRRIAARGHLPSWSPDGKSIVYCDDTFIIPNDRGWRGSRLHVLDVATGAQRDLATEDAVQPNWSPHGQRIAYWGIYNGSNRQIFTAPAAGGNPVAVTDGSAIDWNPVWAPSGKALYFISDRGGAMNLWRIRIDESTGKTHGTPEPMTTPAPYVRFLSWSADGKKFLYSQAQNRISLSSIAFDTARLETVGDPVPTAGNYNVGHFSISPDETRIVHDAVGDPREDLWIVNVDGSNRRKLTFDSFRNRLPRWSPKGDEILYISSRTGNFQEWIIHPDGSGLRQLTAVSDAVNTGVWIDDGRQIVASLFGLGMTLLQPRASETITRLQLLPGLEKITGFSYAFTSSPEKGLLLGHIAGNGENPLVLYSLTEGKLTRLGVRGIRPAWVPGSTRYFVFLREDACLLYDLEQKREKRLFTTHPNQMYFMQITPKGRRIYFNRAIHNANLWMGEIGDSGTHSPAAGTP